jgi:foldase protein PrsA
MYRVFIGILVLLLAAACSSDGDDAPATTAPQPTATIQTTAEPALPLNNDGEQLVARVNGEAITLNEFQRAFDRRQQNGASYDAVASLVLNTLIEQAIINQAAAEMGITISDADIQSEYEQARAALPDDSAWQNWLSANQFANEQEYLDTLPDTLITQRLQMEIIQPTSGPVEQVRARHILVETEDEAREVFARLAAGEDFAVLAAEYSLDVTTRDQGGDLGWFDRDDLLTPELTQVAFSLNPGERTGPVQTMLGYHIVETLEAGQREVSDQERVQQNIDQFITWLDSRRETATIERYIN